MTEITNQFTPEQRKWIDLLKSGQYKQVKGKLKRPLFDYGELCGDGYCCLGLAWDKVIGVETESNGVYYYFGQWKNSGALTTQASESLCLYDVDGEGAPKPYYSNKRSLAGMNDSGRSFAEIAEILEREPYVYFTNFDEGYTPNA